MERGVLRAFAPGLLARIYPVALAGEEQAMQRIFSGPIRSIRATSRTAIFFLKVLPMLPSRPVVTQVRYPTLSGEASGDLYRPAGKDPIPASSSVLASCHSALIIPRCRG